MSPGAIEYDLIVVGSGPAGRSAAAQAARLGARVALVERDGGLGGGEASINGVVPRMLRSARFDLAGAGRSSRREGALDDVLWRAEEFANEQRDAAQDDMRRHGIDVLAGTAAFVDAHTLQIRADGVSSPARAARFVIATGTAPQPLAHDRLALDAARLLRLRPPSSKVTVVGGGRAGLELASAVAAVAKDVTLLDEYNDTVRVADAEIVQALEYHLRGRGLALRHGEHVDALRRHARGGVEVRLRSGERIASDAVALTRGVRGATSRLRLGAAGLDVDARGHIPVDAAQRTAAPHIFAAGGVCAAPSRLPAADEGRLAAMAAVGVDPVPPLPLAPHVFATIPELAFVGCAEQDLIAGEVAYVAGVAHYADLPGARICGDRRGMLKLLVDASTRRLLGVHLLGPAAAELVHVGQAAMAADLTVDAFADASCGALALACAYRVAANDALARLEDRGAASTSAISPMRFVRPRRTFAT